jgi:hypothetical protein
VETFIPQFPRIQECASADKAPAITVKTVKPLPEDADLAARNCNDYVWIKYGGCEQHHHQYDGYARQVAGDKTPPSTLLRRRHFV